MKSSKSPNRLIRLLVVALLCALPFAVGGYYLMAKAQEIDTMPLDEYSGLRWLPGGKSLGFLHRPLGLVEPAPTELWKVAGDGTAFSQVGTLSKDFEWELSRVSSGPWVLLRGESKKEGPSEYLLADPTSQTLKPLKVEGDWRLLPSQGDGFFLFRLEDALPFDQFVDVEEAPDVKPELGEPTPAEEEAEPYPAEEEVEKPTGPPTHLGVIIGEYDAEKEKVDPIFSIPYNTPQEQPRVHLLRRSPDGRFLALVVSFGEKASSGLWVYDKENKRLLWTRALVQGKPLGMDWSSDSVTVAVTDGGGLLVLKEALGIESTRLEMPAASKGLRPYYGPGRAIYLANNEAVYSVQMERDVAEPLFEAAGAEDLALMPLDGRVAYSQAPRGYRELLIKELKTGQGVAQATYPGSQRQKAQGTLTYQVGSAIRYAWKLWFGRG